MGPEANETDPSVTIAGDTPDPAGEAALPETSVTTEPAVATDAMDAPHAAEPAFRVVGLQCEWLTDPHPVGLEGAVSAELALRVQRLSQSVDSALILTDEGVVRFMGEPVARLVRGEETLNPKALVLARIPD